MILKIYTDRYLVDSNKIWGETWHPSGLQSCNLKQFLQEEVRVRKPKSAEAAGKLELSTDAKQGEIKRR